MERLSYSSTAATEPNLAVSSTDLLYIRGRELVDRASAVRAPFQWAESRWKTSDIQNGADLAGRIVAMYARNPDEDATDERAVGEVVAEKVAVLQAHGAVGIIIVNDRTELLRVGTTFVGASSTVPVVLISLSSSLWLANGVMLAINSKRCALSGSGCTTRSLLTRSVAAQISSALHAASGQGVWSSVAWGCVCRVAELDSVAACRLGCCTCGWSSSCCPLRRATISPSSTVVGAVTRIMHLQRPATIMASTTQEISDGRRDSAFRRWYRISVCLRATFLHTAEACRSRCLWTRLLRGGRRWL
jgi:hypothetical protein